ncbi:MULTISPECIES: NmrA family NAD(P)-binding protein [Amycolatopsis]|uniref:NmrA family NAD(P)-binding protein n=1 Tax=Amycolatopsis albidoflavus TaxID=102226 RepID=A0ABW5I5P9_9PSEU
MIVITGATGALNGATVEHLLKRVPAERIGVSVRDVAKAQHFADQGVRVRQGSYEDPAALRHSFERAEKVLLVSSNDPHADGVGLHRVGIEAAVAAGAQRILYTSHQNSRMDTPFRQARSTPRPSGFSPSPGSRGRRCGTGFTRTASVGCSGTGGRPG